jgi:hypothetical protein
MRTQGVVGGCVIGIFCNSWLDRMSLREYQCLLYFVYNNFLHEWVNVYLILGGRMMRSKWESKLWYLTMVAAVIFATVSLNAQSGSQGTVTVTVMDQTGAVVQGADLTLQDLATNDVRKGATQSSGAYSFVGLNPSTYKLSASQSGYALAVYDSVTVHAGLVTDLKVTLKVGAVSETVEIRAEQAPLVESTSSVIGSNIDLKYIEDLPFGAERDLTELVRFTPGYTAVAPGMAGATATGWANGTVNGLPGEAQVTSVDGVIGQSSRGKSGGNANPGGTVVQPRIQNIQEMSIQNDQLDASQGYGQGDMQVTFVTRSGTNRFHGRLFGDLQNSSFFANSWQNDFYGASKPKFHRTDLGGSVGGPILKDKLFFFFAYERDGIPQSQQPQSNFITQDMQNGNYTYKSTADGSLQKVNLFTLAAAQPGLATKVDSGVLAELAQINSVGTVQRRCTQVPGAQQPVPLLPDVALGLQRHAKAARKLRAERDQGKSAKHQPADIPGVGLCDPERRIDHEGLHGIAGVRLYPYAHVDQPVSGRISV